MVKLQKGNLNLTENWLRNEMWCAVINHNMCDNMSNMCNKTFRSGLKI